MRFFDSCFVAIRAISLLLFQLSSAAQNGTGKGYTIYKLAGVFAETDYDEDIFSFAIHVVNAEFKNETFQLTCETREASTLLSLRQQAAELVCLG